MQCLEHTVHLKDYRIFQTSFLIENSDEIYQTAGLKLRAYLA